MTRINLIPVQLLKREHLIAEYREMLRLRNVYPRKSLPKIPEQYKLGKGHVTFFFDKGAFLINRHAQLVAEIKKRGYQANYSLVLDSWPKSAMNDYVPDVDAKLRSVARILNRLNLRRIK